MLLPLCSGLCMTTPGYKRKTPLSLQYQQKATKKKEKEARVSKPSRLHVKSSLMRASNAQRFNLTRKAEARGSTNNKVNRGRITPRNQAHKRRSAPPHPPTLSCARYTQLRLSPLPQQFNKLCTGVTVLPRPRFCHVVCERPISSRAALRYTPAAVHARLSSTYSDRPLAQGS